MITAGVLAYLGLAVALTGGGMVSGKNRTEKVVGLVLLAGAAGAGKAAFHFV